jgi:cation diffusion facilitator CzcD-associated flavoprotein CzcO
MPASHPFHVQVAIIGSGFAGLGMALELTRRGSHDFVVFERAAEVGGTWRDNTYPGCACDIKSDLYSFSFAPNPDWGHLYARQPEILAYLRKCADDYGVRPRIRFGHEVIRADWDDDEALWQIQTSGGPYTARVLVSGHGPLIEPKWPDIPGLEGFTGARFHSARWDHSVDLRGKRVAVIGTGASAIQFVPQIQPEVGRLTIFQRTPPWITPRMDTPTTERQRQLYRRLPLLQRLSRQRVFALAELRHLGFTRASVGRLFEAAARQHLAKQVPDPELRARLTPTYRIGCKRILVSDDYYPALTRPNVELVTEAITEVRADTLSTADGQERQFDVLICGTGFNATRPPVARLIHGRGGVPLDQAWSPHLEALHGSTVAGFPNLFLLVGPNTALGHNSIVYIIEAQLHYIVQALAHMDRQHLLAIEPRPEVQAAYNAKLQQRLSESVWVKGGCTSYYLDATGRNSTLWPERAAQFRQTLSRFDPGQYRERLSPRPVPALVGRGASA